MNSNIYYGHAGETPFGNFPEWGESIERVIGERHIAHPFMEESTSLLFNPCSGHAYPGAGRRTEMYRSLLFSQ